MLTPDLVRVKRSGQYLSITPLAGKQRQRASELANALLTLTEAYVGRTREELLEAWAELEVGLRERRLVNGLCKLVEGLCVFSAETPIEPSQLRSQLFLQASAAWRALESGQAFDRNPLIEELARKRGIEAQVLERNLYADLRNAHLLERAPNYSAERLLEYYDLAQLQAVLLRAIRISATVHCYSAGAYRALFNKLKFRRLLHEIVALDDGRYRIEIDGPYSLFESVTKYGLAIALVVPALLACDSLKLVAQLRWGKGRSPATFSFEGGRLAASEADEQPALPDEVALLLRAFEALDSPWLVRPTSAILNLPGAGLCIPDLLFEHQSSRSHVYLEVLGYWSRDAVWRRVELAQRKGLSDKVLFAVSSRLRVSEAVLDEHADAALYVYKGHMSPRAIERKLEALIKRG